MVLWPLFIWPLLYVAAGYAGEAAQPGEKFRDCADCPQMIVIAPGQFMMTRKPATDGRSEDDPEGIPKSAAARAVTVQSAFALGIYDVTRDEYSLFIRETGRSAEGCYVWSHGAWVDDKSKSWRRQGFRQGGRDPVVCVNWEDANYGADRCGPCQPAKQGRDRWLYTSPVGSFPPNALGLYDMAGNVWQWMQDCLRREPQGLSWGAARPGEICHFSSQRGGSWLLNPQYLQVGEFASSTRLNRNQATGFRVAKTLNPEPSVASETAPESVANAAHDVPGTTFRDCAVCPLMIVIPPRRCWSFRGQDGAWCS